MVMLGRTKKENAEGSLVLRALLAGFVAGYFTRKRGEAARAARASARAYLAAFRSDAKGVHDLSLPADEG